MSKQHTNIVLMIRPSKFGFNDQTATTNSFQKNIDKLELREIRELVDLEFMNFVSELKLKGINVIVFDDLDYPESPDAIFPNNWFSTHQNGQLLTYPLAALTRRAERRDDIIEYLQHQFGYTQVERNMELMERNQLYLEGTGSLVLDRVNNIAYAANSPRTHDKVLDEFAKISGYQVQKFHSVGPHNEAIYHTNVMLSIADEFALIGLDTIHTDDRERIQSSLEKTHTVIPLTNEQIYRYFVGNVLQLINDKGAKFLVMSEEAKRNMSEQQLKMIEQTFHNEIISVPLHIVETVGGGSARCMLTEIFPPLNKNSK